MFEETNKSYPFANGPYRRNGLSILNRLNGLAVLWKKQCNTMWGGGDFSGCQGEICERKTRKRENVKIKVKMKTKYATEAKINARRYVRNKYGSIT